MVQYLQSLFWVHSYLVGYQTNIVFSWYDAVGKISDGLYQIIILKILGCASVHFFNRSAYWKFQRRFQNIDEFLLDV